MSDLEIGDYSCAACGFGMKEPCAHWERLLADAATAGMTLGSEPAPPAPPAAPNLFARECAELAERLARAESELASWRRVAEKLEAENQRLRKALTKIRDYAECGCEDHKHPDCCNNADYHCPFCISDVALSEKGSKS